MWRLRCTLNSIVTYFGGLYGHLRFLLEGRKNDAETGAAWNSESCENRVLWSFMEVYLINGRLTDLQDLRNTTLEPEPPRIEQKLIQCDMKYQCLMSSVFP